MATHSSILACRIPWTEEPGRLQSMGLKKSDMIEGLTLLLSLLVPVNASRVYKSITCRLFLIHNEFSFCFDAIIPLLKRKKKKKRITARVCHVVFHKALLEFSDKLKLCI